MFRTEIISSLEDPRVQPYRNLKRQWNQLHEEIFIAEGEKVVRRLFESRLPVISLLMSRRWLDDLAPVLQELPENVTVFLAENELLEQLVGYNFTQGVLALAKTPPPATITHILSAVPSPRFLVALDGVNNTENVGNLVRNSVAFGAQAVIIGETSCPPYLRRAVRSSMGTVFKIPEVRTENLVASLQELKSNGIRCIAAHPHTEKKLIYHTDFTGDCCIIFGSEGNGVSEEVRHICDDCVAIPMQNEVDSLNVGSAAGVFLYEVSRQRAFARPA